MDQQQSIFDESFDPPIRRRDLLPKWLKIYTWFIIFLGVACLIWAVFFTPPVPANNSVTHQMAKLTRKILPGIVIFLMGLLTWVEKGRAIKFNRDVAILWIGAAVVSVFVFGERGLINGMLLPFLAPYWIGLLPMRSKWEKEAVAGNGFF